MPYLTKPRVLLIGAMFVIVLTKGQAIADYDSAFIGAPLADPIMQHNKETFVLYGCAYCHGLYLKPVGEAADLRKSAIVGTDVDANLIGPILRVGIPQTPKSSPMPQFSDLSDQEIRAIASYIHYTRAQENYAALNRVSETKGSAMAGKSFFEKNCISCHTAANDLRGIGEKYDSQKLREEILQPAKLRSPKSFKLDVIRDTDLHAARAKHQALLENYKNEDVANIVTYLQTFK